MARILMADDDRPFARMVARLLETAGHRVQLAHDGESALAAIRTFEPDMLLLDVALPLLRGDAIAQRTQLPILFVSGRDLDRVAAIERANVRRLTKPVDLDDILREVNDLLAWRDG
ncbi:MAG: response regulator [Candidatus Sericytochromatia bacterium]|nr:response regulator [Candidatus Sericytochromatia bacterium]